MFKRILFISILLALLSSSVYALDVSVSPKKIRQGDAFLIKITSKSDTVPVGRVKESDIYFHQTLPGIYIGIGVIGLEQSPGIYTMKLRQGNISKAFKIRVLSSDAKEIHIKLPQNKVILSPENEKRANSELKRMRSLWSIHSNPFWRGRFIPPLNSEVSTEFAIVRVFNEVKKSVHKGVDYRGAARSEEHTSELQSHSFISYAVFCLKKKNK